MHLTSILLTLAAAATTATAQRPYFCPLSLDASMTQYPYCCKEFVPARDSEVTMEGVDCTDIREEKDFTWNCPQGGRPKCCYPIGKAVICSTEVGSGEI